MCLEDAPQVIPPLPLAAEGLVAVEALPLIERSADLPTVALPARPGHDDHSPIWSVVTQPGWRRGRRQRCLA